MISIARMTHRITLMEPVEEYDPIMGKVGEYVERETVWAEFLRPGFASREAFGNSAAVEITQGIRIRDHVHVAKRWRVRDVASGRTYEVEHIDDHTKGELVLTCIEWEM